MQTHPTHRLFATIREITGEVLHFCKTCGAYAQVNVRGLAQVCPGRPLDRTEQRNSYKRQKLLEGCHPATSVYWGVPRAVGLPTGTQPGCPLGMQVAAPPSQDHGDAHVSLDSPLLLQRNILDDDDADPFALMDDWDTPDGNPWEVGPFDCAMGFL